MFKIGDIVRPKIGFIGHEYCFKIIEVEMNPFDEDSYKLQGIKQDFDPIYGSTSFQVNIIDKVEQLWWKENTIELTSNVKLRYDAPNINVSDYKSIVLDEKERNLLKLKNKVKEENEMQILDLYEKRKTKLIIDEYSKAEKEVKKEDEIQSIILEMTDQVNTILKNQNKKITYEFEPNLITLETEIKIDKLKDKRHEELEELRSTLDEIRALFELTDDYNERIKILKNYDILDKKGKLNV